MPGYVIMVLYQTPNKTLYLLTILWNESNAERSFKLILKNFNFKDYN